MKKNSLLVLYAFIFISCEHSNPAFRFSNFYDTPAENIAKAIKRNDVEAISNEVLNKRVSVDFEDNKYEVSLLELALTNNKKEAFEELLKLGANPNIDNSSCVSPLVSAIRYNHNCDLYFVERLLDNNANIMPRLSNMCTQAYDPIQETIMHYNDENKIKCGLEIIKLLTNKLDNPDLLFMYNDPENYHENIIYNCLNSSRNLSVLKYLIVDLKYKVPEQIFIDGTVLLNFKGYKSLEEILNNRSFTISEYNKYKEKAKNEILDYLKNQIRD